MIHLNIFFTLAEVTQTTQKPQAIGDKESKKADMPLDSGKAKKSPANTGGKEKKAKKKVTTDLLSEILSSKNVKNLIKPSKKNGIFAIGINFETEDLIMLINLNYSNGIPKEKHGYKERKRQQKQWRGSTL